MAQKMPTGSDLAAAADPMAATRLPSRGLSRSVRAGQRRSSSASSPHSWKRSTRRRNGADNRGISIGGSCRSSTMARPCRRSTASTRCFPTKSTTALLIAATTSMMAAGHPVRVWSYSPNRLEFLLPHGIAVSAADDVMPRTMFERIVASSEIRYFSDIFRYAVLYEHGGLWMDSDIVMLRPFPFSGDHFFNLQWRGSHKGHFVCGNVIYAKPYSRHLRALYEMSIERFHAVAGKEFGDIGPKLLSDYIASDAGSELHGQADSARCSSTRSTGPRRTGLRGRSRNWQII
ncbi:glycosyltransferase [Mesorhizobium atlanticum]